MATSERDAAIFVVACGVSIAIAGPALLWGIAKVLPALGVAIGTGISIAGTASAAAPWVAPTLAFGVTLVGGSTAYVILRSAVEHAKRDLFSSILPILSIWTGAIVEVGKEAVQGTDIQKALYAIVAGALVLASGMMAEHKGIIVKLFGGVVALLPALLYFSLMLQEGTGLQSWEALLHQGPLSWLVLALLTLTSVGVAVWGASRTE